MPHSAEKTLDTAVAAPATDAVTLDINQIQQILPHRYPFLLIDRITGMEPGKRVTALKSVTMNEPYFAGHFPGHPVMPGVLVVEAMAQAGGLLIMREFEPNSKLVLFTGIDKCKFRKQVTPGDQLRIEVTVLNWRSRAVKMGGNITVDGKLVCDATVMCQVVPRLIKKAEAGPETAE